MRLRTLAAASAVGLVASLAPTMAAEAAAKPTFKVSISASATKADVGQQITVSGKVAGPQSAGKRLAVQRKVGADGWKTIAKVRATQKRRYSASVTIGTAGAHQLRVVAPKSAKARQGVSAVRSLTAWRWLDAGAVGTPENLLKGVVTIQGQRLTQVWTTPQPNDDGALFLQVNGKCDALTTGAAVEGDIRSTVDFRFAQTTSWQSTSPVSYGWAFATGNQGVVQMRWPIKAASNVVGILMGSSVSGTERAAVIAPRVHCSVNSLPKPSVPLPL